MSTPRTVLNVGALLAGYSPELRSPWVAGLAALLGGQLLLALVLGWGGTRGELAAGAPDQPLLVFAPEQIVQLHLAGADGDTLVLERQGDTWVLPELHDFPVQGAKVEQLLDDLAALRRASPVATSAAARERFKVDEQRLKRRLTLTPTQGEPVTLFVGDSSGFRRLFARAATDQAIYEVNLALADLSTRSEDWIAHDALHLNAEQITRITGSDWTLERDGASWRLASGDAALHQAAVAELLRRVARLNYRDVLDATQSAAQRSEPATLELELGLSDGTTRRYQFWSEQDGAQALLASSAHDVDFRLASYDLGDLLELTLEGLVQQAPEG